MKDVFDNKLRDSQATAVSPISPEKFDIEEYASYEAPLNERCARFWQAPSGVLVYRRMRVAEVFSAGSRDMQASLAWQLGALKESMKFKADIPNFLEPWYGLGVLATAYGVDYVWAPGQAPAIEGKFASTADLLAASFKPVAETPEGRHNLEMIEYFLDKTRGRLPLSYCDIQSPLNTLSNIIDTSQFYLDFCLDPDSMQAAMDRTADLTVDFVRKQTEMIGDALVKPGHGFSSSRVFDGLGLSDDSVTMMSPDLYLDLAVPAMVKAGLPFGGPVFHSCGNWSDKKADIVGIPHLRMADGAFSLATDPGANPTEGFADTFAGTGVVLNVRIVGGPELVEAKVRELWKPGMKLIVVTYCQTPEEQAYVYDRIHEICQ
ncbi:MAG: hypothetical protein IJ154_02490 [Bacteroidales bacterium]|nr:hypothetical protein [Bacteroidales bacterium]